MDIPKVPRRSGSVLLAALISASAVMMGACSGGAGSLAGAGANANVDGDAASEPDADGRQTTDGGAPDQRVDGKVSSSTSALRIGAETFGKNATQTSSASSGGSVLRCPRGSLVTGIDIGGPDLDAGAMIYDAEKIRLVCSKLEDDGTLGPGVASASPFDPALVTSWTPVRCPSGKVATRVVGAKNADAFLALGLRCDALTNVADGQAIGAGAASVPALFGATPANAPPTFDDPCPAGAALSGFSLEYTASYGTPYAAGFTSIRTVCRSIFDQTVPGGGAYDVSKPFALGAVDELPPLNLTKYPLPSSKLAHALDCPAGAIVVAVDVGRSQTSGSSVLEELGITCRKLGVDGVLGDAETHHGLSPESVSARCLDGAAITKLAFAKNTYMTDPFAEDVMISCAIPAPGAGVASSASPAAAPGYPDLSLPPWKEAACPNDDEVVTGIDVWRGDEADSILQAVTVRCRAVTR